MFLNRGTIILHGIIVSRINYYALCHKLVILCIDISDLLAKGLTTGQSLRYLAMPYRRPKDGETPDNGKNNSAANPEEEKELPEQDPETQMTRQWYNMVCYGLPNLMVTQTSK